MGRIDELMDKRFDLEKEFLADEKFMSYEQIQACLKEQRYVSKAEMEKDGTGEEVTKPKKEEKKKDPVVEEPDEDEDALPLDTSDDDDDDDDDDPDALLNDM